MKRIVIEYDNRRWTATSDSGVQGRGHTPERALAEMMAREMSLRVFGRISEPVEDDTENAEH